MDVAILTDAETGALLHIQRGDILTAERTWRRFHRSWWTELRLSDGSRRFVTEFPAAVMFGIDGARSERRRQLYLVTRKVRP